MGLIKREYTDRETLITAENLNEIQDAILDLEDGLFTVDNNKSGEIITITDAAKRGFRSFNIYGKTTQDGTPTPDAPVDLVNVGDGGSVAINVTGKNILPYPYANTSKVSNGITFTDNGDGSITIDGTASAETYFYLNSDNLCGDTTINAMNAPNGATDGTYTISYLLFYNGLNGTLSINILAGATFNNEKIYPQVELGSSATAYEPYKGQTCSVSTPNGLPGIPVSSGGNYIDANGQQWICDEIDLSQGVYVRRTSKYTFSGSDEEGWTISSLQTVPGATRFDISVLGETRAARKFCLCNAYAGSEYANFSAETCWCNDEATIALLQFRICTAYATTVEELKEIIQANPVNIVYQLATPVETPLSEEEIAAYEGLHTYRENTTVSNDGFAYMELEYVMDAKKYIDGKISTGILAATVE